MAAAGTVLFLGAACAETWVVGKVVGIVDGDSIAVLTPEDEQRQIRLSGIDAPERGQQFGYESLVHLSDLCFGRLALANCPKVDQYGRLVCSVTVDGVDLSLAQITAGLAWHYKRFAKEQPELERIAYAHAEVEARASKSGLWQETGPVAPWEWRTMVRSSPRQQ